MKPEIVFKAMADGTRQRVLIALSRHELSVSELVEVLRQPQSTVSRHLKTLREAGLIRDRRDGSTVLYAVVEPTVGNGEDALTAMMLSWVAEQQTTSALDRRLEAVIQRRSQMSDRFFHDLGRHWDTLREESFGAGFHLEAPLALLPPEWVVADLGTGTGYMLPALANHFSRVIGVDPVEAMLEGARHRVALAGLTNVELHNGDLSELPISDEAVDLAVAVLVLHHVPVLQRALVEIHRIVRPGGRVLIVEQFAHEHDNFRDRMQDHWFGFEPAALTGQMESAGFDDVRLSRLATVERAADAPDLMVATGTSR